MTNRKLRKILKQNQINAPEKANEKRKIAIHIPRRVITRTAQITACLALVCALGLGYVAMLRFVGRPGGTPSNDGPGSQLDIESPADTTTSEPIDTTTLDPTDTTSEVVGHFNPDAPEDTTKAPEYNKENLLVKIYAAGMVNSDPITRPWTEFHAIGDVQDYGLDMRLFHRMDSFKNLFDISSVYFSDESQYLSWVKNSAMTGSDGALITGEARFITNLAVSGLLDKIKVDDYIDYESEYWPENMEEELSVGDNLYFVSGIISPNTVANTYIIYANPNIDALLDVDIHGIVEQGKWTFDKMYELSAQGGAGLNGSADYGLVLTDDTLRALGTSAGVQIASNSATAHASLSDGTALDFVNSLADLLTANKLKMTTSVSSEHISTLFYIDTISSPATYNSESKCELLPMPAITEGGKYRSPVSDKAIYYSVAAGTDVRAQAMLETMSAYMNWVFSDNGGWLSAEDTVSGFFSQRYATSEKSKTSIEIAIDNMTFSLDSFLTTSVTNSTLKNALNAADENRRQEILTQSYFNSVVMAQLGSLK